MALTRERRDINHWFWVQWWTICCWSMCRHVQKLQTSALIWASALPCYAILMSSILPTCKLLSLHCWFSRFVRYSICLESTYEIILQRSSKSKEIERWCKYCGISMRIECRMWHEQFIAQHLSYTWDVWLMDVPRYMKFWLWFLFTFLFGPVTHYVHIKFVQKKLVASIFL